jgi:hypothetical protein
MADHQAALLEDRREGQVVARPADHREASEVTLSAFTARPAAAVGDRVEDLPVVAAADRVEVPAAALLGAAVEVHREEAVEVPPVAVIGLLAIVLTALAHHPWQLKALCLSR